MKTIFKSSIVLLVISNLGNFFQYLIQIVLGRSLSPAEFGVYNTVNSIFVVMMAFSMVISFVTAREFIKLSDNKPVLQAFTRDLLKKTVMSALVIGLLFAVFSRSIACYFALESAIPILICAAIMTGLIIQAVFTGMLQGMARYVMLSTVQTFQTAIRLFFIVIIVIGLHFSYNGALLGVFLSYMAVILYYLYFLRDHLGVPAEHFQLPSGIYRNLFQGVLPIALMWAYMGIVSNIDIPIVKHFMPDHDAGIYSSGAVIGRIAWFLPSMLVFVLFPEVVRNEVDGKSSIWHTVVITGITFIISFGIAAVFAVFPETILTVLMGGKYAEAKQVLAVVSFSMAIVAILSVLYSYCLAKKMTFFLYPAYGILMACIILIYWRYHASSIEVAYVFLAGLILTLVTNTCQFIIQFKPEIYHHLDKIRRDKISFWRAL